MADVRIPLHVLQRIPTSQPSRPPAATCTDTGHLVSAAEQANAFLDAQEQRQAPWTLRRDAALTAPLIRHERRTGRRCPWLVPAHIHHFLDIVTQRAPVHEGPHKPSDANDEAQVRNVTWAFSVNRIESRPPDPQSGVRCAIPLFTFQVEPATALTPSALPSCANSPPRGETDWSPYTVRSNGRKTTHQRYRFRQSAPRHQPVDSPA